MSRACALPCMTVLCHCREAYKMEAMFLHDPTAFAAVIAPECFTWKQGAVRVVTEGLACGMTIMDLGNKTWNSPNGWMGKPAVKVALNVNSKRLTELIYDRLKL